MRRLSAFLLLMMALPGRAQDIATTDALTPENERKSFKLPPGFQAQLVASEPAIEKPMQLCWDAKGRLWVTTSHTYPFPSEPGKSSDKLFILSDFDDSGKAMKVEVFDDKLNIPIGVLPLPDGKSVIVSSVGQILKLTDTDGDGKADKREVLFDGFGTRDTHGMVNSFTLLPDGWVYACHGYLNTSKVKGKDGHEIEMNSGNTFRFRPDGSRIEVYTRGQVNPFGITVDPWGNLYTADCHTKPITQLIRGAVYDSFGKPHDGLGYAPHVTDHDHGSTALCGLSWYQANHFPPEFDSCMFLGNVVTNKINADKISWNGCSPIARELPDFLVSGDPWFRPTDIKLGPDGALYVSDFYNKIIGHYEVALNHPLRDKKRGRIWRIIWTGKDGKGTPAKIDMDLTKASEADLWMGFQDRNVVTRILAANEYVQRASKDPSFHINPQLAPENSPANLNAIGLYIMAEETLKRNPPKPEQYRELFSVMSREIEKNPELFSGMTIRAMSSKASWGEIERGIANECLKHAKATGLRRAAIDGIIAHPHADFIPTLIQISTTIPAGDVIFRHAAKVALRNCFAVSPATLRSAEFAKVRENAAQNEVVIRACLGLPTRESAECLARALLYTDCAGVDRGQIAEHIGKYGSPSESNFFSAFLGKNEKNPGLIGQTMSGYLRGIRTTKNPVPEAIGEMATWWAVGNVDSKDANAAITGLNLLRELKPGERAVFLITSGKFVHPHVPVEVKMAACETSFALNPKETVERMFPLIPDANVPIALREKAASLAAGIRTPANLEQLKQAMKAAPYRLAVVLSSGLAADQAGANLLFAAVKSGEAPARVLQERVVQDRLKAAKIANWETSVRELTKGIPANDDRLNALIRDRATSFAGAKSDVARGKEMYGKNCAACHQIAGQGGKIGPNLDGVGIRGVDRLLEDILDPNRNVDIAFRATILNLADGRVISGLLLREEGAILVMADSEGKELRINKADVEKRTQSNTSPMPADWGDKMKPNELHDLLAYLLTQKAKDTPSK
ncbi:MAG: PVC-type heme-binding CxxCH protein [Gemmataceae bacterium]